MESKGTVEQTLNAGEKYTIQPGYYSGGTIQAKDLESQTNGTAVAGNILNGKTAYVKGKSVKGTMTDNSGKTVEASEVTSDGTTTTLTIPENGFYSTESKIKVNAGYSKVAKWVGEVHPQKGSTSSVNLDVKSWCPFYSELSSSNFIVQLRGGRYISGDGNDNYGISECYVTGYSNGILSVSPGNHSGCFDFCWAGYADFTIVALK